VAATKCPDEPAMTTAFGLKLKASATHGNTNSSTSTAFGTPMSWSEVDGPDRQNSEVDGPGPIIPALPRMNDSENSTLNSEVKLMSSSLSVSPHKKI
jgi:hypothetical protein